MAELWCNALIRKIKSSKKICILGIGNIHKGDDGAGPTIIKFLKEQLKKVRSENLKLIDCAEIPENFTGDIRKFQPDLTVIVDVCNSGKMPGTIFIVDPKKIRSEEISTHRLPLSMFVKFLEETIPTKVIVIGIEPKNLNFGDILSPEVNQAVEKVASLLAEYLNT